MVQLLDLPQELILLIAENIPDRKTTLALWSSCQDLHNLLTAPAFSHLVLDFRGESHKVRSSIEHLGALADGTALGCRYARTLEIWSLRNLYDGTSTKYTPFDYAEMLEEALSHLEALESLSWLGGWGELTSIEDGALRGIKTLASSHPNLTATAAVFRPDAPLVERLQEICPTYALLRDDWDPSVSYGGSKYYTRRDTSVLAFTRLGQDIYAPTPSFVKIPAKMLSDLTYWLPIANFKGIQTLIIFHIPIDVSETIFSQPVLWMALRDAGVQPIEFCVDFITDSMLDYLSSFSNLRYICLMDTQNHRGVHDSQELADKFFKKALGAHKETLQTLVINVMTPGPWFLQHSNMKDLLVCRKLKKLAICLPMPIDATSKDLLYRALNLRKSLPYLYQLSILEGSHDTISPGGHVDWTFDILIEAFKVKGPPITALGRRYMSYRTRCEMDGSKKVLRYEV